MKEPLSCAVIRDLLPLYADGACSDETAALVEEHTGACPECRELLEKMRAAPPLPPEPAFDSRGFLCKVLRTLLGAALALAVMAGCFAVNAAGAWDGGPASAWHLAATLLYVLFWGGFTAAARKYAPCLKLSFGLSLLTFFSAAVGLICRLLSAGGFLAAFACVFASIPFYGLRFVMGWTGLYAAAAALSLLWLLYTGIRLRGLSRSLRGQ